VALVGQYGLERLENGRVVVDPSVAPYRDAIASAAAELERELAGLLIERKGGLAVTVHWRTQPERKDDAIAAAARIAGRHGLAVSPGRAAIELRAPVPIDKGSAVSALLTRSRIACFAGDDRADVEAFVALARLVDAGRLETGIRIAVRSAESPRELIERADLVVEGPPGLVALLDDLAMALDG
jgi:trehalose 6-phosphate phosphatase